MRPPGRTGSLVAETTPGSGDRWRGVLREHLARECDTLLHPDYLARLMAKHGIVYRRPRHIMGHLRDPEEYDEKKEIIKFLKKTRSTPKGTSTSFSSMNVKFISTRP